MQITSVLCLFTDLSRIKPPIQQTFTRVSLLETKDKKTLESAVQEAEDWISSHPDSSKSDYQEKLKALQKLCDPLMEDDDDEDSSYDEL